MIAVIADDLTGAAEVAGLALSHGLRVTVLVGRVRPVDVDVLVIATSMRSSPRNTAERESAKITRELLGLDCRFIYKKTDSVLRGHIGSELLAQMRVEEKSTALFVPANPSHERTIRDGIYYVDGVELGRTAFAALNGNAGSGASSVTQRLRSQGVTETWSIDTDDPIRVPGIYIGDVASGEDLKIWAERLQEGWVPAGGADFFAALLEGAGYRPEEPGLPSDEVSFNAPTLLVCGSRHPESREYVEEAIRSGVACVPMPDAMYFSAAIDEPKLTDWARRVTQALADGGPVIVGAFQEPSDGGLDGRQVANATGRLVTAVLARHPVRNLMLEGGATAQAVISELAMDELVPSQSLAPGVTQFVARPLEGLRITMKPGSYAWPGALWPTGNFMRHRRQDNRQ